MVSKVGDLQMDQQCLSASRGREPWTNVSFATIRGRCKAQVAALPDLVRFRLATRAEALAVPELAGPRCSLVAI